MVIPFDVGLSLFRDMSLELFRSLIITQPRIQERVLKGILAAIHRERYMGVVEGVALRPIL